MRIVDIIIRHTGQHGWTALILNIHDGQCVLVITETDLPSLELLIRPLINHTLGIMDVAVLTKTASKLGVLWISDVYHMEATGTRPCAHGIHETGFLVAHYVVGARHLAVVGIRLEFGDTCGGWSQISEACQVKDLHAVVGGFADNEGVVIVDLGQGDTKQYSQF